jgi:hypothetical protein
VDLVHLMLYNLTVYNAKKYYDLDTVIIPYANDNWYTLQLPPRVNVLCYDLCVESEDIPTYTLDFIYVFTFLD